MCYILYIISLYIDRWGVEEAFVIAILMIHIPCLKGGKYLHHCLIWANVEDFMDDNRGTEART